MLQLEFKTKEELKEWAEKIIKLIPTVKKVILSRFGRVYITDGDGEGMFVGQTDFRPPSIGEEDLANRPTRLDEKYLQDTLVLADLHGDLSNRVWYPRYSAGKVNNKGELLVYKYGATYVTNMGTESTARVRPYDKKLAYCGVEEKHEEY